MNGERQAYQQVADIAEAIEQAGRCRVSSSEIIEMLRRIQLGWPAEREFVALSIWMRQCVLIHRLDKEGQYPQSSRDSFRVPDLFAVYDVEGHQVPVLIEVKSTEISTLRPDEAGTLRTPREGKLIFGQKYYEGLRRYAETLGLPLLVAWKIRNFDMWFLFDINAMQKKKTAYFAEAPDIAVHDLMGVLLGNVFSQVAAGSKWVMEIRKLHETGESGFDGKIERSALVSPKGQEYRGKGTLFPILAACDADVELIEDDRKAVQSIIVPVDWGVIAYRLLGMAVRGFGDEEIEWLDVLREEKFQWAYDDLLRVLREGIQLGFVNHVIHPYPQHVPDFLKGKLRR